LQYLGVNRYRELVVEAEASAAAADVDSKLTQNDMVAVDVLMAVSDQEEIVFCVLIRRHHRPQQTEGLGVEVLDLVDKDMFVAGVNTLGFQHRTRCPRP